MEHRRFISFCQSGKTDFMENAIMKKQRLIKNITDQIKEAQMKLGFVRESIRLYFPWDSFMVLLEKLWRKKVQAYIQRINYFRLTGIAPRQKGKSRKEGSLMS